MEAWRASEDLKAQVGIHTNLAIVNMLIPEGCGNNAFFDSRRQQQKKYLPLIMQKFPVPLLGIPLFDHEPEGMKDLSHLGDTVFSGGPTIEKVKEAVQHHA
jgi:arsenite-transporting ATPase